ncbi:hypothetical protein B484DRAFT_430777, partial [Ochromonadaceae sp. CCMP2298]
MTSVLFWVRVWACLLCCALLQGLVQHTPRHAHTHMQKQMYSHMQAGAQVGSGSNAGVVRSALCMMGEHTGRGRDGDGNKGLIPLSSREAAGRFLGRAARAAVQSGILLGAGAAARATAGAGTLAPVAGVGVGVGAGAVGAGVDAVWEEPEITDRVYIDVKIANYTEESVGKNRPATGSGRIVIGLYGKAAPKSAKLFLDTVLSDGSLVPSFVNAQFSKVSPEGLLGVEKISGLNTVQIAGTEQWEYAGNVLEYVPILESSGARHT